MSNFSVICSVLLISATRANMENFEGCPLTDCVTDGTVNYFPNEVEFEHSQCLRAEYHDTYKLSFLDCGGSDIPEVILYVQCGCPVPELDIVPNATVSVPVEYYGIQSTTNIPFLHYLSKLKYMALEIEFSDHIYPYTFTDSCHKQNVEDGTTIQRNQPVNYSAPFGLQSPGLDTSGNGVSMMFYEGHYSKGNLTNPITITEYLELTPIGKAEWLKLFSMPFNMEKQANEIFDGIESTVSCVASNAEVFADYFVVENYSVMIAYEADNYVTRTKEWSVTADCAVEETRDYYCENFGALGVTKHGYGDGTYRMNDTEFDNWVKETDPDVLIFTAKMNITALTETYPFIKKFSCYKNQRIYDVSKRGMTEWYSSATLELDAVFEDFASVTRGPNFKFLDGQGTKHERVYLRNVFNETEIDPLKEACVETKTSHAEQCIRFSTQELDQQYGNSAGKLGGSVLSLVAAPALIVSVLSVFLA